MNIGYITFYLFILSILNTQQQEHIAIVYSQHVTSISSVKINLDFKSLDIIILCIMFGITANWNWYQQVETWTYAI